MSNKINKFIDLSSFYTGKKIDWNKAIGNYVHFEYGCINGLLKIINHDKGYVLFEYENKEYKIKDYSFSKCQFGNVFNFYTNSFKVELSTHFNDNNRDLIITGMEYRSNCNGVNLKWYKYKCNKCKYEGWIEESHLMTKQGGCSCCVGRTVVKGINDLATTHPWMIKFFCNEIDTHSNTASSHTKVKVRCPDCGRIRDKKINISEIKRYNSINCSCKDGKSYPEKFMFSIMEQLGEDFIQQLNKSDFDWCEKYKYDFYIKKLNLIIETNGIQHYEETSFKITLKEQKDIDDYKRKLALSQNISDYISLDCRYSDKEYIKNSILNSTLKNYFDLNNIDWNKADEFATKNLIKEVCEYYEKYKNIKLKKDIATNFKISVDALLKYLHKGNELGWCIYEKYNEKSRIRVIDTGDIFDGIRECCREFEIKYKVKLNNGCVSRTLNGKSKSHKGYHFEYVS